MENVKINITSSQTGLRVKQDLRKILKNYIESCSFVLIFIKSLSLFLKHLDKLFSFIFLKNTVIYVYYIYYIIIINNIYNNKNEDCIGKKWIFSNFNDRKVDFLSKSNVTLLVCRGIHYEF